MRPGSEQGKMQEMGNTEKYFPLLFPLRSQFSLCWIVLFLPCFTRTFSLLTSQTSFISLTLSPDILLRRLTASPGALWEPWSPPLSPRKLFFQQVDSSSKIYSSSCSVWVLVISAKGICVSLYALSLFSPLLFFYFTYYYPSLLFFEH